MNVHFDTEVQKKYFSITKPDLFNFSKIILMGFTIF